jgi:hypothetical protein
MKQTIKKGVRVPENLMNSLVNLLSAEVDIIAKRNAAWAIAYNTEQPQDAK